MSTPVDISRLPESAFAAPEGVLPAVHGCGAWDAGAPYPRYCGRMDGSIRYFCRRCLLTPQGADAPRVLPEPMPDATLVKSTRPHTCAVCREVVTASILLPEGVAVCSACAIVALRHMVVDAEACRDGDGSGAFRPSGERRP